jgi:LPS export ABC transporter protein LptC
MGLDASKVENTKIMNYRIGILLLCVIGYIGAGCAPKDPPLEQTELPDGLGGEVSEDAENGMDQKMLTFTFSEYTQEGKKKMEIEGESADIFSGSVKLSNLTAHIHDTDQKVTITSDRGTFDRSTHNVQLISNVVAQSEDGSTITTDSLDYNSATGVGITDDFTRITREDMVSTGVGAIVYSKERRARLNEDVRVQLVADKKEGVIPTIITCEGSLELDYEKRTAVFHDNVIVQDERGTVVSDLMEVYLTKETKEISQIVCTGNVHVQQGGNQTFSDNAVYLAQEGRVILTGTPKLVLYPDELKESDGLISDAGVSQDL